MPRVGAAVPQGNSHAQLVISQLGAHQRLVLLSPFPPERTGLAEFGWALLGILERAPGVTHILVLSNQVPDSEVNRLEKGTARVTIDRAWQYDSPRSAMRVLRQIIQDKPGVVVMSGHIGTWGRGLLANAFFNLLPLALKAVGIPTIYICHARLRDLPLHAIKVPGLKVLTLSVARLVESLAYACSHRVMDVVCEPTQSRKKASPLLLWNPYEELARASQAKWRNPSIVAFGTWGHHKRLELLLGAWKTAEGWRRGWTLTLLGGDHPKFPGYLDSTLARAGYPPGLELRGTVPRREFVTVVYSASVVIVPSDFLIGSSLSYVVARSTGASVVVRRSESTRRLPIGSSESPDAVWWYETEEQLASLLGEFFSKGEHSAEPLRT